MDISLYHKCFGSQQAAHKAAGFPELNILFEHFLTPIEVKRNPNMSSKRLEADSWNRYWIKLDE